jgi:hypothetical protein
MNHYSIDWNEVGDILTIAKHFISSVCFWLLEISIAWWFWKSGNAKIGK